MHSPEMQYESASILTVIASGTCKKTNAVVDASAVPALITLLGSPHLAVARQALCALGTIARNGPEHPVIKQGLMEPFLELIRPDTSVRFTCGSLF